MQSVESDQLMGYRKSEKQRGDKTQPNRNLGRESVERHAINDKEEGM